MEIYSSQMSGELIHWEKPEVGLAALKRIHKTAISGISEDEINYDDKNKSKKIMAKS